MIEEIKFPSFFFFEGAKFIRILNSIDEVNVYFEPENSNPDKLITGFDSKGRKIYFKIEENKNWRLNKFVVHSIEGSPIHKQKFYSELKGYLSKYDLEEDWLANASLDDLVSKAHEIYSRPIPLFKKIIHSIIISVTLIFLCLLLSVIYALIDGLLF